MKETHYFIIFVIVIVTISQIIYHSEKDTGVYFCATGPNGREIFDSKNYISLLNCTKPFSHENTTTYQKCTGDISKPPSCDRIWTNGWGPKGIFDLMILVVIPIGLITIWTAVALYFLYKKRMSQNSQN